LNDSGAGHSGSDSLSAGELDTTRADDGLMTVSTSMGMGAIELIHKMDQLDKVRSWRVANEPIAIEAAARLDAEFPSILDRFITQLHHIQIAAKDSGQHAHLLVSTL